MDWMKELSYYSEIRNFKCIGVKHLTHNHKYKFFIVDRKTEMIREATTSLKKGEAIVEFLKYIEDNIGDKVNEEIFRVKSDKRKDRKLKGKRCKKCGFRMTKLYRHSNRKDESKKWYPVSWYCVDCDKMGDRIKE